ARYRALRGTKRSLGSAIAKGLPGNGGTRNSRFRQELRVGDHPGARKAFQSGAFGRHRVPHSEPLAGGRPAKRVLGGIGERTSSEILLAYSGGIRSRVP